MEELELYKGLKSIALKQLEELHRKGSMSPAEAEAAKTAMCIIEKAKEAIEKYLKTRDYDLHHTNHPNIS